MLFTVAVLVIPIGTNAQPQSTKQTVTVGALSATIEVIPVLPNEYEINAQFHSSAPSTYAAGCLSAYRDLQYTLYDNNGKVVPLDPEVLRNPPFEGKSISGQSAHMLDRPPSCSQNGTRDGGGYALLSKLYPHLPAGTYSLRVSFAPRGLAQQTAFVPVPITIH